MCLGFVNMHLFSLRVIENVLYAILHRFCFYRKKVELEGTEPSMPVLPREKDGVLYMWPEEAARLFYTKCNFCHKR